MRMTAEQEAAHRLLSRYASAGDLLDANLEALDRAESRRFNVSATMAETVMSSGDGDRMANALAAVERHIAAIEDNANRIEDLYQDVHGLIEEVVSRDRIAGTALAYWYGAQLGAAEIAERAGCSEKTVYERIRRGLDLAYDIVEERRS